MFCFYSHRVPLKVTPWSNADYVILPNFLLMFSYAWVLFFCNGSMQVSCSMDRIALLKTGHLEF